MSRELPGFDHTLEIAQDILFDITKAHSLAEWLVIPENRQKAVDTVKDYNYLIYSFNQLSPSSSEMDTMPESKKLKALLLNRTFDINFKIPTFWQVSYGNFLIGLINAHNAILDGEKLHTPDGKSLKFDKRANAIVSASLDTSPEALFVAITGHVIERSFFAWANHHKIVRLNFKLKDNSLSRFWKKDDFLHVLIEVHNLEVSRGKTFFITPFLTNSPEEGGLGWIK